MKALRNLRGPLAALALGMASAVVVVAVPTPAQAATATIKASDGLLLHDCSKHPVKVKVKVPDSAREWVLNVNRYRPDGEASGVITVKGNSSGRRTTRWIFCLNGFEPGTYQFRTNGYWTDKTGDIKFLPQATRSVTMRIARTRTKLTVSDTTPRTRQLVKFRSLTLEERPGGKWRPVKYGYVRLQRKSGTAWTDVENTSTFVNRKGRVVWRDGWLKKSTFKIRAFSHELSGQRLSKSKPITITVRRSR